MLNGFLGQLQSDFEATCAADFSEVATFTDGATVLQVNCIFDASVQHFDPDTQSHVLFEGARVILAETAYPTFNFRRAGIPVSVRGSNYKIRANDWEFDGIGSLVLYLNPA